MHIVLYYRHHLSECNFNILVTVLGSYQAGMKLVVVLCDNSAFHYNAVFLHTKSGQDASLPLGKIHSLCMYIIPKIIDNTFHNNYCPCVKICSYIGIENTLSSFEYFFNKKYNLRASSSFFKLKGLRMFTVQLSCV